MNGRVGRASTPGHPCVPGTRPITLVLTVRRSPIRADGARSCGALLALACTFAGSLALAESAPAGGGSGAGAPAAGAPAAGADALATARAAWEKKHFAAAELSYKSALDHGGLAPADTLDAYIHLGAARARLGKKELARAAFRQAALIDRHFKTPPEAGKRAATIAALARRDEAKLGSIMLGATIPPSVAANEAFGVTTTLDSKHAALTAKVSVEASDPLSGKHWETSDVASAEMRFDVPASVATPGANLIVRVDALDPHNNRLASREQRVRVEALPAPPPAVTELVPAKTAPPPPTPPAAATFTADLGGNKPAKEGQKHGGILSSPWFYVVGGAVLAAGGAFAFYELRPSENVSLGSAQVVTR
jgi:hypothetical protein